MEVIYEDKVRVNIESLRHARRDVGADLKLRFDSSNPRMAEIMLVMDDTISWTVEVKTLAAGLFDHISDHRVAEIWPDHDDGSIVGLRLCNRDPLGLPSRQEPTVAFLMSKRLLGRFIEEIYELGRPIDYEIEAELLTPELNSYRPADYLKVRLWYSKIDPFYVHLLYYWGGQVESLVINRELLISGLDRPVSASNVVIQPHPQMSGLIIDVLPFEVSQRPFLLYEDTLREYIAAILSQVPLGEELVGANIEAELKQLLMAD